MNAILLKIWNFLKVNNRWAIALVILLLLFGGTIIHFKNKKISDLQTELKVEIKLRDALLDSVKFYKNKRDELVAEKLTIQETIKNLEKMYGQLTADQKDLIERIKQMSKDNSVIAAALIRTEFKVDSLLHRPIPGGPDTRIDTAKKTIEFTDTTNLSPTSKYFKYDLVIGNVLPISAIPKYNGLEPSLLFKHIEIPNEQFAEFHWKNNKKKGYPISFSISNSNKYIKVIGVESYAIPPLDKLVLNPSGWDKFGNFMIKNGRTIMYIGIGAGVGAGAYWLLTK